MLDGIGTLGGGDVGAGSAGLFVLELLLCLLFCAPLVEPLGKSGFGVGLLAYFCEGEWRSALELQLVGRQARAQG